MNKVFYFSVLALCVAIFAVVTASADESSTMYVQSAKAKIMASPDFKADVLTRAEKGESVSVINKSGSWYQVKFNDKVGWVSRLVLSTKPPIEKKSVLKGDVDEIKQNARRRASNSTTAAATRGLRKDDLFDDEGDGKSDFKALKKVEDLQIRESDVWDFNQELKQE